MTTDFGLEKLLPSRLFKKKGDVSAKHYADLIITIKPLFSRPTLIKWPFASTPRVTA